MSGATPYTFPRVRVRLGALRAIRTHPDKGRVGFVTKRAYHERSRVVPEKRGDHESEHRRCVPSAGPDASLGATVNAYRIRGIPENREKHTYRNKRVPLH